MNVAQDLEFTYGHRQIEDSLKKAKVSRSIVLRKPSLNAAGRKRRLNFAHWALERLDNGDIFIFFDETYIEIGEICEKT